MIIHKVKENEYEIRYDYKDLNIDQGVLREIEFYEITFMGISNPINYFKDKLFDIWKDFLLEEIFEIKVTIVEYETVDVKGNPGYKTKALVIAPLNTEIIDSYPILASHHATQLYRKYAPSNFVENLDNLDKAVLLGILEQIIYACIASKKGYVVVMPDYQGMKPEEDFVHPFIVSKCLGRCGADAIVNIIQNMPNNIKWNGQLFLAGYSEGGYAAMATSKELQENYSNYCEVTASAPGGGPYSLLDAMRLVMLRDEIYEDGYYLIMVLRAYNQIYGDLFSEDKMLKKEFRGLYELVDGEHTPKVVNEAMQNSEGILIPRNVMSEALIKALADINSDVCERLKENDLTNWKPKMPMRLYHNFEDDRIPYKNAVIARDVFLEKGSDVSICEGWSLDSLYSKLPTSEHLNGFFPYIFNALSWFDTFRYDRNRSLLKSREALIPGSSITSKNKKYELRYQFDGDLVIYDLLTGEKVWNWNTRCKSPYVCLLKDDGIFLLYNSEGEEIKSTAKTSGNGGCRLIMEDDGKGIIYDREDRIVTTLNDLRV